MHKYMLAIILALGAPAAVAHDDHVGPNGGYTKHLGSVNVELVAKGSSLQVYVADVGTGQSVVSGDATARAVVLVSGKTETVALQADGGVLKGSVKTPVPAGAKVALTIRIPERDNIPSTTFDLSRLATLPKSGGH